MLCERRKPDKAALFQSTFVISHRYKTQSGRSLSFNPATFRLLCFRPVVWTLFRPVRDGVRLARAIYRREIGAMCRLVLSGRLN